MPGFDTRNPQGTNEPTRSRVSSIASTLRASLMANRLRSVLIVFLLVVVALVGGQRIYSFFAPQNTARAAGCVGTSGTDRQRAGHSEASNGKIAFIRESSDDTNRDIYAIDEDGADETRLTHTTRFEGSPVWSPDGEKMAFFAGSLGNIYVMDADGTNQSRLATSNSMEMISSPAWSPDGDSMVYLGSRRYGYEPDIYVMDADGANKTRLTSNNPDTGDITATSGLVWSPDGKKIGFASHTARHYMTNGDADSSAEPASAPVEGLTGIYISNADRTGLCKLTSVGVAAPTAAGPTWSPDGNKIAFYDKRAIYLINPNGAARKKLTGDIPEPTHHAWSPDGERLVFLKRSDLYVINADGSEMRRLTNNPGPSPVAAPTWSPDGEKIAFSCPFDDPIKARTDLCVINADGTGLKRIASNVAPEGSQVAASWGRE